MREKIVERLGGGRYICRFLCILILKGFAGINTARCEQFFGKRRLPQNYSGICFPVYIILPGLPFYDRCSYADEECVGKEPTLTEITPAILFLLEYNAKKNN